MGNTAPASSVTSTPSAKGTLSISECSTHVGRSAPDSPVSECPRTVDPMANQSFPLPTDAMQPSTTSKAATAKTPEYPSQQMSWNAMFRRGWHRKKDDINSATMDHSTPIDNTGNEAAWREVLKWEALHRSECCSPALKSFGDKATDLSPRARIRGWMGYELPFDRHDCIVDRCGKHVRYVVDYYDGGDGTAKDYKLARLDVRPALDSFEAVKDRMKVACWRWRSSGAEDKLSLNVISG